MTRFGRYETTLGAGLHWRWPAPLEQVRREKVELLRSIQIGFRAERGATAARGTFVKPVEWQAEHAERGYMSVPGESSLLAGDEVALDLTAEAHYRIINLKEYAEGTSNPAALLRAAAEGATRQVVAARVLDEILAEFRRTSKLTACMRYAKRSHRTGWEWKSWLSRCWTSIRRRRSFRRTATWPMRWKRASSRSIWPKWNTPAASCRRGAKERFAR